MKKLSALLLIAVLLSACGAGQTPAVSDAEMQTKVAAILTAMPTATGGVPTTAAPNVVTATSSLPTVAPTATQPAPTAAATKAVPTAASTAASTQPPAPTATKPGATAAPTATKPPATPVPTQGPTATLASSDPRAALGQPTWQDKMSTSDNWPTGDDPAGFTSIDFKNGALLLTALKNKDGWRMAVSDSLTNFYLEETVNTGSCSGKDRYGLIFRVPVVSNPDHGYLAAFTCDGQYSFRKWDGPDNSMSALTIWKTNKAINTGPNQVNRLGVLLQGGTMTLYANGIQLTSVSDPSYTAGFFGIFSGAITSSQYTVSIKEVDYWIK
jgi:hypothetical protein